MPAVGDRKLKKMEVEEGNDTYNIIWLNYNFTKIVNQSPSFILMLIDLYSFSIT